MRKRFPRWAFMTPKLCRHMSEYYAGVMDYLKDRPEVVLERLTFSDVDHEHMSTIDGFITYGLPPKDTIAHVNKNKLKRVPTVAITMRNDVPSGFAVALINPDKVAGEVVDKFIQRHCASFAFCTCHTPFLAEESAQLLKSYRNAVWNRVGEMPHLFRPLVTNDPNMVPSEVNRFLKWVKSIPRPCGIFVHGDDVAKKLLDACRVSGIKVPQELRVIGTGNSPLYCERTHPALSSYAVDHERAGYLAAKALNAMLEGAKPADVSFELDAPGVVERASTIDAFREGELVESVRRFIRDEIKGGVSPSILDIAHHCNVSKSKLQEDFKATTGHSVHDELAEYRLEVLAKLLKASDDPVKVLAARAGLAIAQANRVFQKRHGMTMTEYRNIR